MRILFVLLFLSAVLSNELVIGILCYDDANFSLCENPTEQSSEKESQDQVEDESKIEQLNEKKSGFELYGSYQLSSINSSIILRLTPYLEIHSPPPELV